MTDKPIVEIVITNDFSGGSEFTLSVAALVLNEELGTERARPLAVTIAKRIDAEFKAMIARAPVVEPEVEAAE